jgi:type I restriction enzyme R subunit
LSSFTESIVEEAALGWLRDVGYSVAFGPDLAAGQPATERGDSGYRDVVLVGRLRAALLRLNPHLPGDAVEDALRKVTLADGPSLVERNRAVHRMLVNGVNVEYKRADGSIAGEQARIVDFGAPGNNDWLAVNQFTVAEGQHERRPDIVVFLNGLPVGVIELKNAAAEKAGIWKALEQLKTYQSQIGSLFNSNAFLIISDGTHARIGAIGSGKEWFKPWRTVGGRDLAPTHLTELQVLIEGVFEKRRMLDFIRHFIVFEDEGDRRAGVVWHTQGSGKSFTMLFFAARMVRHPSMQNPTLVVLTDRNDLDDQLFGQFQRCHEILGQAPVQAAGREHLRELLQVASGGVVFTTIQKFIPPEKGGRMPELSARRNIVVIADEAHRSQYDLVDGLARNLRDALPNASFIGFTGTPIDTKDANTRAIFGDYISIYDIQQAVADKATVPIYYESRIAKLGLNAAALPTLDDEFEEITEGEEDTSREQLKSKWAALEAFVGDPKRIKLIAADLVAHFERRLEAMDGKAMIVCMSRRICVELYAALIELRPDWASAAGDDAEAESEQSCVVKVIMTGSAADGPEWQPHIRNKSKRRALANRFKDSKDPFRIVIVRDMWLTGFDAPCLHTMYADKPMQGHGLMQAIARVNRVFRDKPGGLVVDYLGLADQLKQALATYSESGGRGDPTFDPERAISVMLEKHGIATHMLHGLNWALWSTGTVKERFALIPEGQEHILAQPDGKTRFIQVVKELSAAFALCATSDEATEIRDDVCFFQNLQAVLHKGMSASGKTPDQLNAAVRQLVSKAIVAEGQVIDVFTAAGLPKPDISILSDQFLAEVRGLKHKNVAVELLEKLLRGELQTRTRSNLVQSQLFSEKLQKTLNAYHNRAIATHEVIDELIKLAKEMSAASKRNADLGLTDEEIAFYDALAANESALAAMGDATLKVIAAELITQVRKSVTIDWTLRERPASAWPMPWR